MSLVELALKRPVTTIMAFVTMIVVGLISLGKLPLEKFPDVDAPFVFVQVPYPGSSPAEIERLITRPVEAALATIPGIRRLNSESTSEAAGFFIEFSWASEVATKAVEAREKVEAIRDELPSDVRRVFVFKFSTSDEAVIALRVSGNYDPDKAYALLERKVKRPLERIPGVARVQIQGVQPEEVQIELRSDRVTAHGIDVADLNRRLNEAAFASSAGLIQDGSQRFRVQPVAEFKDLDALRNLVISDAGVRLSDIAEVRLRPGELDFGRRLDGKPAVGIDIFRERGANLVEVATRVMTEVNKVSEDPELAGINIYLLENQAESVTSSISELGEAGLIGTLLSVLVLYAFLRHWPSTLMVSLALPVCFTMTLGLMYFFGVSLNVLSMMGLLLGVGMLVDNAVVVVESIYQQRDQGHQSPKVAAIEGTRLVQLAVSAGTLTSIVVFAPQLFGDRNMFTIFFGEVAFTITISLLTSWLVAVTLIPMLAARIKLPANSHKRETWIDRLRHGYARFLDWTLTHRGKTLAMTVGLIVISFFPISQVKQDAFADGPGRAVYLNYRFKADYRLEELERTVRQVEAYLEANKEKFDIRSIYSWYGQRGGQTRALLNDGEDARQSVEEAEKLILEGMPKLATADVTFRDQSGPGNEGLQVALVGDSTDTLVELADAVVSMLSGVEGLRDVRVDGTAGDRELTVRVDRERARAFGVTPSDVASLVGIAMRGVQLREFRDASGEKPVWLRFENATDQTIADLADLKIPRPGGEPVPLLSVVDWEVGAGARTIRRTDRQTSQLVRMNPNDVPMEVARERIEAAMKAFPLPPGYSWSFGSGFRQEQEGAQDMVIKTLLAIVLIYVVMAALFESLLYPAAIMVSILFSILGVFWFFWITDTTFSIMANIGILVLIGVVVNNGIVMVEHVNTLRRDGLDRRRALVEGCRDRLRPILMTVATTVLGLIPLCIGTTAIGGDGPPYFPMARAIVGGLLFSTIVTLLILPSIYALLDDWRSNTARLFRRVRARGAPGIAEAA